MRIEENISLAKYNTFGIDVQARRFVSIEHEDDLSALYRSGLIENDEFLVLGGGSNMVFVGDFPGTIIHLENKGFVAVDTKEWNLPEDEVAVEACAGEVWDSFVRACIVNGWYGLENLIAIPGTVGASAVQNVGAYGMEAKDVILEVRLFDMNTGSKLTLANADCHFGYRDSVFKHELKNRFVVTSVVYRLKRSFRPNLGYKAVTQALDSIGMANPTAAQLAEAITNIRWSKLPKPEELGSAGSFFKNPVVSVSKYEELKDQFPELVAFPMDEGHYKLAAGWLIEHAGWKGKGIGPVGVYEKQALVIVNRDGCDGRDVLRLADAVTADVDARFGVVLEKEAIIVNNLLK